MLPLAQALAIAPMVLFYPPDPVVMSKPDSMVLFDSSQAKTGKEVFSYNDYGWLSSAAVVDTSGAVVYSSSAEYSWRAETLCVKFNYSLSADHIR
jgi:hypothetical protein